ncbi:MAG: hypothetical protein Tsb0020_08680 [Haliangiales bacterium]
MFGALVVFGAGCSGNDGGDGADDAGPVDSDAGPVEVGELTPSLRPTVKFKGNARLQNDFARALELDIDQVCVELGRFSCAELVHRVPLGGSSAFDLGLYQPLATTTLTSPIAVERVAMSACVARAERDFAALAGDSGEAALIFSGIELDAAGALRDVSSAPVAAAIDTLYKRALQRRASASEIAHLRALYDDIAAAESDRPARDWAALSCFAVMTTMEQLFY